MNNKLIFREAWMNNQMNGIWYILGIKIGLQEI